MSLRVALRRPVVDEFLESAAWRFPATGFILDVAGIGFLAAHRGRFQCRGDAVAVNAVNLQRLTGSFVGAVCADVLQHSTEPSREINELARLLSSGAVLLLTVPLDRSGATTWSEGERWWRGLLESAGFTVVSIEVQWDKWTLMVDAIRLAGRVLGMQWSHEQRPSGYGIVAERKRGDFRLPTGAWWLA